MTLGERIEQRLEELGPAKNVLGLAAYCGVTDKAVYQWMAIASRGLKPHHLVKAAEYLQTHCQWLVFEKGPKDRMIKSSDLEPAEAELIDSYRRLTPDEARVFLQTIKNLASREKKKGRGKLP